MFIQCVGWVSAATLLLWSGAASAQQPQQPQQPQQTQQPLTWEKMPQMQLEEQFAGPLKDTAIQRWRDPHSGVLCYVYLPFTVQHTPPTANGYVQYGPNTIGAISCLASAPAPAASAPAPAAKAPIPPAPKAASPPARSTPPPPSRLPE